MNVLTISADTYEFFVNGKSLGVRRSGKDHLDIVVKIRNVITIIDNTIYMRINESTYCEIKASKEQVDRVKYYLERK